MRYLATRVSGFFSLPFLITGDYCLTADSALAVITHGDAFFDK